MTDHTYKVGDSAAEYWREQAILLAKKDAAKAFMRELGFGDADLVSSLSRDWLAEFRALKAKVDDFSKRLEKGI